MQADPGLQILERIWAQQIWSLEQGTEATACEWVPLLYPKGAFNRHEENLFYLSANIKFETNKITRIIIVTIYWTLWVCKQCPGHLGLPVKVTTWQSRKEKSFYVFQMAGALPDLGTSIRMGDSMGVPNRMEPSQVRGYREASTLPSTKQKSRRVSQ